MAIDVCSEIPSLSISPRISFSHDLNQAANLLLLDDHDHDRDRRRLDPASDFDFCTVTDDDFTFEISSADQLFSQGRILPAEIKPKEPGQKLSNPPELSSVGSIEKPSGIVEISSSTIGVSGITVDKSSSTIETSSRVVEKPRGIIDTSSSAIDKSSRLIVGKPRSAVSERKIDGQKLVNSANNGGEPKKICSLKELLSASLDDDDDDGNENDEKSRRGSGNHKSFWQFRRSTSLNLEKIKSLHFISRSNSTGSGPNPGFQRQKSLNYRRTTSFSGTSRHCYSYGKGGVSPVLNLPQPYIAKVTIGFFGIGSLFCNGKHRKKKK